MKNHETPAWPLGAHTGLTKHEYATLLILQGLLAAKPKTLPGKLVAEARELADELFKETL